MPSNSIQNIRQLIDQGRYLEARLASEALLSSSDDLSVKQVHALALSKSGIPLGAAEFFAPVHREYPNDAETAGIMGGIYKELFRQTQDQKYAILSRDAYLNNFLITHHYYTGINAATMSAIAGKFQRGREIAQEVLSVLPPSTDDFWELVTMAEARLLIKESKAAAELYFKAHQLAGQDWGKLNIVYNQLWMLNHYMLIPSETLKLFSPPVVAVLVGHMIDHPLRPVPRFQNEYAGAIKQALSGIVKTLNARIGYTSLACGSDILFAEVIREIGGEINIFLPFSKEDFLETSVRFAGEDWVNRFDQIASSTTIHYLTREAYMGNDDLFAFHGRVLFGLAILRGRMLHSEPYLLTILSERDRTRKEGGTRDLMKLWPFPSRTQNIDPSTLLPPSLIAKDTTQPPSPPPPANREVLFMAEIAFEGALLLEAQRLARKMQTEMSGEMISLDCGKQSITAGFNTSYRALTFCRALVQDMERKASQIKYRVGMHAGPVVLEEKDGKKIMTGTHANILHGIFDLSATGSVYASEPCAASLVLDSASLAFIHTGTVQLQEPLGMQSLYRMDWTGMDKTGRAQ